MAKNCRHDITYKKPYDFSQEICFSAVRIKVSIRTSWGMLILEKNIIQLESVISLLRERANGSFVRGI